MISRETIEAAVAAFVFSSSSDVEARIRDALEAAEAAAWLPYDEDKAPAYDVLLYWPAAGVDDEIHDVGRWRGDCHQWACDRRDPPTRYRLIVGPK